MSAGGVSASRVVARRSVARGRAVVEAALDKLFGKEGYVVCGSLGVTGFFTNWVHFEFYVKERKGRGKSWLRYTSLDGSGKEWLKKRREWKVYW